MDQLGRIPFYVQYTITSYGRDLEPGVPDGTKSVENFCALSKRIGADRVVWRYDPVLLSPRYSMEYHCRYFEALSKKLSGYTKRCVFSFLDEYTGIKKTIEREKLRTLQDQEQVKLAKYFLRAAQTAGMQFKSEQRFGFACLKQSPGQIATGAGSLKLLRVSVGDLGSH